MTRPEYVVTREGGPSANGLLDFGPAQGKLHKLEVDKNHRIFYVQIAFGKLAELTKLAEELNAANEPMAEAVKIEPDDVPTVGVPTVQILRDAGPETRARLALEAYESALNDVDGGLVNLPQFRRRVAEITHDLREDFS